MSHDTDPPRLRDPAACVPPELAAAFDAGARDLPSNQQLGALELRLGSVLTPAPNGAAPPRARGRPRARWVAGAGGALALALLAGVALHERAIAERAAPSARASGASMAPNGGGSATPEPASGPEDKAVASESAAQPTPALPHSAPSIPPSASSPSAAPRATPAASQSTALDEARLLERARRVLDSNPALALALARQHQQRFPNGLLKQEREVIAIEALRRLGRSQEAATRADGFAHQYPDSAHRRAVETGLAK